MMIGYKPIVEVERADVLDALRGFALLGIFVSHVPDFSGYTFMSEAGRAAVDRHGLDGLLDPTLHFLIQGKFFSLFSLLFGIGFAVQLESALRSGRHFASHFARRLSILLLIGAAHALIWYGDILKDYALIGLLLIVTARWSASATGIAAGMVLLGRALWPMLMWHLLAPTAMAPTATTPAADFAALTQTFAGNDPAQMFAANLDLLRLKALQIIYDGKAISILAMFLLGAYIGKRRIYRDLARHTALFRRVFVVCAPIGIVGNAQLVSLAASTPAYPPSEAWVVEQMLAAFAVPAMTLAYAASFALLWTRFDGAFLRALAPTGRMALTTYVSQTLIGVTTFYGIGYALHGTLSLAECVLFALAVFAAQCAISTLWFRFFRFGPIEWLWRRATYGTRLPMLKRQQALA